MGQFRVPVEGGEVRIKDNVFSGQGCHLWVSLWRDGDLVRADERIVPVDQLDDEALIAVAKEFAFDA